MPRQITAYSNPLVKHARDLRDRRRRREAGQFLAEGLRILSEAQEAGRLPRTLFFADASHPRAAALVQAVEAAGGEAIETTADILSKLSGKDNPQAIVGLFDDFGRSLDSLDRHAASIWLVAERLRDPGNLGTILRTGDAVGAGGLILLDECVDPFSVEAVRASMGSIFNVPIFRCTEEAFVTLAKTWPGAVVGTSPAGTMAYDRFIPDERATLVVMGNEQAGMTDTITQACTNVLSIPIFGKADSLNISVAAGIVLYCMRANQNASASAR